MAAFYGVQASPIDDTVWGQSMDVGFSRLDQPGYIDPPHSGGEPDRDGARRTVPAARRGLRHRAASTSPPTAWCGRCSRAATWRASIARSARRRSRAPRPSPARCARRAGRSTSSPARSSQGVTDKGSAQHAYYIWVDRENTLGPRQERADRLDQWRRGAHRARRRQVRDAADSLSARLLLQERRRPHRRSERRLEGQGHVDDVRQPRPVPQRGRHRRTRRSSTRCRCARARSRIERARVPALPGTRRPASI